MHDYMIQTGDKLVLDTQKYTAHFTCFHNVSNRTRSLHQNSGHEFFLSLMLILLSFVKGNTLSSRISAVDIFKDRNKILVGDVVLFIYLIFFKNLYQRYEVSVKKKKRDLTNMRFTIYLLF